MLGCGGKQRADIFSSYKTEQISLVCCLDYISMSCLCDLDIPESVGSVAVQNRSCLYFWFD